MKTKYILHGGMMKYQTEANRLYYCEMVKGIATPKILLVYFAREDDEVPVLLERDKNNFAWANPGVDTAFTVASEDSLVKQVKANDIIFFSGGENQKLIDSIKRINANLKEIFIGKVVSGSSAGANLVARWYYTNSGKEIRQGLGLLPIAVWAHYRAERGTEFYLEEDKCREIEDKLKAKIDNGELVFLREQGMVVYESDAGLG